MALAVISAGYHWFDSEPVEPEILGTGYLHEHDNGMFTVQIASGMYFVSDVYFSVSEDVLPSRCKPIDGALVTVANFTNAECYEGQGINFFLGRWNEEQIEKAFYTNGFMGAVMLLFLIFFASYCFFRGEKKVKVKVAKA